ncbi:hypothetical protein C8R47DRAFT_1210671 [Mycena vitilis]|nr:hypothetical protein C8R47DRAFT_1210671 [Mycena vitilis]
MLDIPSESLFSLLTAVRTATPPPAIPIPDFPPVVWGDVLEIQGPQGSALLLYILLATCVMPASQGGWGKAAVIFDTDGTFDARRFHKMLLSRIGRAVSRSHSLSDDNTQLLAATALQNLHVFRPASSAQLAASIYNLPAYHRTHLPGAEIALVAVDSLSAFYWPDRFTAEQLRPLALPNSSTPLQHALIALQSFRVSHNPVTVLTNWALTLANNSGGRSTAPPILYKQHLPSFPSFPDSAATSHDNLLPLTHHITLNLPTIPPFYHGAPLPDPSEADRLTGYVRRSGNPELRMFVVETEPHDL